MSRDRKRTSAAKAATRERREARRVKHAIQGRGEVARNGR